LTIEFYEMTTYITTKHINIHQTNTHD